MTLRLTFNPTHLSPLNFDPQRALRSAGIDEAVVGRKRAGGHTGGTAGAQRVIERHVEGALQYGVHEAWTQLQRHKQNREEGR